MRQEDILRLLLEIALIGGIAGGVIVFLFRRQDQNYQALQAQNDRELQSVRLQLEAEKREAEVQTKELLLKRRDELEQEFRQRQEALELESARLRQRETHLDERLGRLDSRESELEERERSLDESLREFGQRESELQSELTRIAGLDRATAREMVMAEVEALAREEALHRARELENDLAREAEQRAKRTLISVMERANAEYVTEATVAVVTLPSDEMKGRLIGREGRNIRAFEQVTGVDLIIDETPEAVVISSFDPIRREKARLALMNLMLDGRIHPGRIEELYEKASNEVERTIFESGDRAAEKAGVTGLPPRVIETMGRLRFRTSYAQNVLDHSVEVAQLASMLAAELGLNAELAKRAGFLHDIGKGLPAEIEGPHAIIGMEFLREFEMKPALLNAVGAHHREITPESPEAELVIVADSLSAARPGARRENLDNYVKRLAALEKIATGFRGVDRAFAMQAGRELRVVVVPEIIDDLGAHALARELAKKIETEMDYPGQIRVTVIRETRIQEVAK